MGRDRLLKVGCSKFLPGRYVCRRRRGAESHLHEHRDLFKDARVDGQFVSPFAVDIKAAFDTAPRGRTLEILIRWGTHCFLKWYLHICLTVRECSDLLYGANPGPFLATIGESLAGSLQLHVLPALRPSIGAGRPSPFRLLLRCSPCG